MNEFQVIATGGKIVTCENVTRVFTCNYGPIRFIHGYYPIRTRDHHRFGVLDDQHDLFPGGGTGNFDIQNLDAVPDKFDALADLCSIAHKGR